MSLAVVLRRPARAEFDEGIDWYEQQQVDLGDEFADRVQDVFNQIAMMPEMHAVVHRDIRKASVRKFPYLVFYRIRGNRVIVLSVFHTKRNPAIWQSRA